jgi:hypothetical protein
MRTCTVCAHPERAEIDRRTVLRLPYRTIADQFGVSKTALIRHAKQHLPETLRLAEQARKAEEADRLLWDLRRLQARTLAALGEAEGAGDLPTALRAVKEARENLTLMMKARGDLDERPVLNVLVNPQWISLRTEIVAALRPFPEAREAVAERLRVIEGGRLGDE